MKLLNINQKLMDDLGANVTPAIYYMSKTIRYNRKEAPDKEKLNIIMGNK
jgi:thiol:disulfide interchange protein DsbG